MTKFPALQALTTHFLSVKSLKTPDNLSKPKFAYSPLRPKIKRYWRPKYFKPLFDRSFVPKMTDKSSPSSSFFEEQRVKKRLIFDPSPKSSKSASINIESAVKINIDDCDRGEKRKFSFENCDLLCDELTSDWLCKGGNFLETKSSPYSNEEKFDYKKRSINFSPMDSSFCYPCSPNLLEDELIESIKQEVLLYL